MLDAVIYRSVLPDRHIQVSDADVRRGYTTVRCDECGGTGLFELPDGDRQKCVRCKGRGKTMVSV